MGLFSKKPAGDEAPSSGEGKGEKQSRPVWNMGMLNDKETIEVPGRCKLYST